MDDSEGPQAPEWLSAGMAVEVLGEEEGYAGSFSCGMVVEVTGDKVTVEYDEFLTEDETSKLKEVFDTANVFRLRPALPKEQAAVQSFKQLKPGHTVEFFEEDCWWVAIVKEVEPRGSKMKIMLTERNKELVFVMLPETIRRGHVWVPSELRWYRRRVTVNYLRTCGVSGNAAQRAVEDMMAAPMLFIDGGVVPAEAGVQPSTRARRGSALPLTTDVGEDGGEEAGGDGDGGDWAIGAGGRSKRENKSRVVYINGQPVLKENMYDLENGEPSVFAHELGGKGGKARAFGPGVSLTPPARTSGKGPDYLYQGARRAPGQAWSAVQDRKEKAERSAIEGGGGGQGPARNEHNESVRRDRDRSEAHRSIYLKAHVERIRPFISAAVHKSIMDKAATAAKVVSDVLPPEPVMEQPKQILAQMREYQLVGLQWLVRCFDHGINAILADEMGLGKTLQSIAFLAHLKYVRGVEGPHLVVVPLSVLPNWVAEFRKFCPEMRVVRLHVNDEGERKRLRKDVLSNPGSFDVAITTYDMVHSQHFGDAIRNLVVWRYLILDEGHKVKNEETLVSQTMRRIARQHVLMLTGTPVQNNLRELYALLNFMYPDVFFDPTPFDSAFNLTKNSIDDNRLAQAHYLLRPFMLRRIKDEVECKLPPRMETRINCPLSEMQTFWYRRLLLKESSLLAELEGVAVNPRRRGRKPKGFVEEGEGMPAIPSAEGDEATPAPEDDEEEEDAAAVVPAEGGSNKSYQRFMNLLMQLRKCCNHPFMFPDSEPDYDGHSTGEEIVEGSGKMQVLDRLLIKLQERGHRVVLFSQFNIMLDVIEDYLIMRGYKYRRLDGSTNRIQRMIDIEMFNKKGSELFIYILCTRAGGLGVNLQTADTCILYDSDWNPQWDLQAMARVHRIGQTKPVHVYRLCSEGTVEDRIQRRAEQKLYLDQMVNRGSTAAAEEMEALDKKELMAMLKFGADRIFKNDKGRMMSEEELDSLLDRSQMMADDEIKQEAKAKAKAEVARIAAGGAAEPAGADEPAAEASAEPAAGEGAGAGSSGGAEAEAGEQASAVAEVKLEESKPSGSGAGGSGGDEVGTSAAAPAAAAAAAAASQALQVGKCNALEFDAKEQPLSTFMLDGIDYKKLRELQSKGIRDIARDWVSTKRERKQTTTMIEVAGVGQGGISVAHRAARKGKAPVSARQIAGRDYGHMDFCQVCWDGGNLLCCDYCPASMHPQCIDMTMADAAAVKKWACPQHSCATCGRNTAAAGGLLFRCEACPNAFCEDCLPEEHEMVGECDHFKALGQVHPKQACFILCSVDCKKQRIAIQPQLDKLITECIEKGHQKVWMLEDAIKAERDAVEAAAIEAAEMEALRAAREAGAAPDDEALARRLADEEAIAAGRRVRKPTDRSMEQVVVVVVVVVVVTVARALQLLECPNVAAFQHSQQLSNKKKSKAKKQRLQAKGVFVGGMDDDDSDGDYDSDDGQGGGLAAAAAAAAHHAPAALHAPAAPLRTPAAAAAAAAAVAAYAASTFVPGAAAGIKRPASGELQGWGEPKRPA
ncbi:hypothetical protein FOA52_009898 [Chlamydomonas sp. UWO 241]|nr:hypothetical protein FOA52_009898 [Chlamydomonas sp. UWO 241]